MATQLFPLMTRELGAAKHGNGEKHTTEGAWILKSPFGGEVDVRIICFDILGAGEGKTSFGH